MTYFIRIKSEEAAVLFALAAAVFAYWAYDEAWRTRNNTEEIGRELWNVQERLDDLLDDPDDEDLEADVDQDVDDE